MLQYLLPFMKSSVMQKIILVRWCTFRQYLKKLNFYVKSWHQELQNSTTYNCILN